MRQKRRVSLKKQLEKLDELGQKPFPVKER
jgi:hypothetical protein